jgi:hypothetical protein
MATEKIIASAVDPDANFKLLKLTGDFQTIVYAVGITQDNQIVSYEISFKSITEITVNKKKGKFINPLTF